MKISPSENEMNNFFLKNKQNLPIWLKISVIFMIGLGIFFRFGHLDKKAIWFDEAFTLLAISGHTVTEVGQEVSNNGIVSIVALDKYQHINPDRGVNDTVRYLITSDPQHPPLYYVLARLWAQLFGDSATGVRSLSAVISLLIFPSVYWLCLELFESPVVGWVAMGLMAISPLEIFFGQDARQYGLWMVTILVSSAALLRNIRRETLLNWTIYSLTLVAGLYTHLFTVLVAIAHGIYIVFQQRFRLNKTLGNYLLATIAALFMFSPWIVVLITHISLAKKLTSHVSFFKLDNPVDLIAILLTQISRIFFDINFSSYTPGVNQSFWEIEPITYSIISGIFSLLLILYIFYVLLKKGINQIYLFLIFLGVIPSISLLLPDMILGGVRSTIFRYQLPLYLSLQIAVAYTLSIYIFSEKCWHQRIWQCVMIGFLVAGLISDVSLFKADTWWIQIGNKGVLATAKYINKFEKPLYLTSNYMPNIGELLILSHMLYSSTNILMIEDGYLPILLPETDNIFLFDDSIMMANSNNLITRFKEDKTYSFNLIDEPLIELWQVEKIQ